MFAAFHKLAPESIKLYVPLKLVVYPPANKAVAPGLSKIVSNAPSGPGDLNLAVK